MTNKKQDRVANVFRFIREHPVFSWVLVIGITMIGLARFTDAIEGIVDKLKPQSPNKTTLHTDNRPSVEFVLAGDKIFIHTALFPEDSVGYWTDRAIPMLSGSTMDASQMWGTIGAVPFPIQGAFEPDDLNRAVFSASVSELVNKNLTLTPYLQHGSSRTVCLGGWRVRLWVDEAGKLRHAVF